MSELMWVPCPAGAVAGKEARLSVLVVPRLKQSLAQAGLLDWPAKLGTLTIAVDVRRGAQITAVGATLRSQADSQVWKSFFDTMAVTPYQDPSLYRVPPVEETDKLARRIASTYETSARKIADEGDPTTPAANGIVRAQLQPWLEPHKATAPGPARDYRPPDFHRAVSLLREHPHVLRALGLIFDLTIKTSTLPHAQPPEPGAAAVANAFIRVRCANAGVTVVSPWTGYEFDGQRFLPASSSDIRSGMVDLKATNGDAATKRWEIITVDADNGAARLRDAARAVLQGGELGAAARLPTLRSAGLMLLRRDRAEAFTDRSLAFQARSQVRDTGQVELTADDLVLGYRIDIQPLGSSRWFSLCERQATYKIGPRQIGAANLLEEGQVKPNAARGDGSGNLLPTDQVVARWNGWSLALPPPQLNIAPTATDPPAAAPALPFDFKWQYAAAPKSLPRLRFGNAYLMRVRVADMAGNGLCKEIADTQCASEPVTYTRWEPIPPPEVPAPAGVLSPEGEVIPGALGPAGTVDQLVVRSDPAATTTATHPPYPPNSTRDILPPPTTRLLAEQHRVFDTGDANEVHELLRRSVSVQPALAVADAASAYDWLPDPAAAGVAMHVRATPGGVANPLTLVRDWTGTWPDHLPKKLELTAGQSGTPADIGWWDQKLVVRLAPAQQVTLELSSSPLTQALDNFSIWQWVTQRPDALVAGRHPMMTPPRLLHLVHAVRRPLRTPAGPLNPQRLPDETFVRLIPPASQTLMGVDPNSTVQVDVAAAWSEPDDDKTRQMNGLVQVLPVALGAKSLPELRHEFGDTRHRQITYELKAISRFRRFFATSEPEAAFQAAAKVQVTVPSSARPAPPVIVRAAPSFRWEGTATGTWTHLERTRHGGLIRIELGRPWYDSGFGEQIAALVWPGAGTAPPPEARPFVTWLSRDPIWATPYPATTAAAFMFTGAAARRVRLPATTVEVDAIPYEVTSSGDTWNADLALPQPVTTSYCPFVRLALARYQPNSLPGLELSNVVLAEPVPLLPARKLIADRGANGITLKLTGLGPEVGANRVKVVLERCQRPTGTPASAISLTTLGDNDLDTPAWVRTNMLQGNLNANIGPIAIPAGDAFRLVVRETETLTTAASGSSDFPDLAERTVFADVIPVS